MAAMFDGESMGVGGGEVLREVPEANEADYMGLDPRVIWLWRLSSGLGSIFFLGPLLGLAVGVGGFVFHRIGLALLGWLGVVALFALWLWWYPPRAFRAWGYRLDGRVLELRSGIWFRVVRLLPLSRLQHVDLQRGPLERSFGLASLDGPSVC